MSASYLSHDVYVGAVSEEAWSKTHPHGLVDGSVAVAMGVLVVRESARLAGECRTALLGSGHCCPAE